MGNIERRKIVITTSKHNAITKLERRRELLPIQLIDTLMYRHSVIIRQFIIISRKPSVRPPIPRVRGIIQREDRAAGNYCMTTTSPDCEHKRSRNKNCVIYHPPQLDKSWENRKELTRQMKTDRTLITN